MTHTRSACGASPSRGRHQRPGKAGSAVSAWLGRVRPASRETQFLFISHNKIAMEMAEQLIGVTMQEQGVSRIVAVDMEAAVSMAEAA